MNWTRPLLSSDTPRAVNRTHTFCLHLHGLEFNLQDSSLNETDQPKKSITPAAAIRRRPGKDDSGSSEDGATVSDSECFDSEAEVATLRRTIQV